MGISRAQLQTSETKQERLYRWSKTIVGQVDLTAKLCLSFCLELQTAKSTYQHVDLDL